MLVDYLRGLVDEIHLVGVGYASGHIRLLPHVPWAKARLLMKEARHGVLRTDRAQQSLEDLERLGIPIDARGPDHLRSGLSVFRGLLRRAIGAVLTEVVGKFDVMVETGTREVRAARDGTKFARDDLRVQAPAAPDAHYLLRENRVEDPEVDDAGADRVGGEDGLQISCILNRQPALRQEVGLHGLSDGPPATGEARRISRVDPEGDPDVCSIPRGNVRDLPQDDRERRKEILVSGDDQAGTRRQMRPHDLDDLTSSVGRGIVEFHRFTGRLRGNLRARTHDAPRAGLQPSGDPHHELVLAIGETKAIRTRTLTKMRPSESKSLQPC